MAPSGREPNIPWSVPLRIDDVPEAGRRVALAADEQARQAIAALSGLRALPRLEAVFDVTRRGRNGARVSGVVSATVEQACVVTLDPIESTVEETVDVVFVPPAPDLRSLPDVADIAVAIDTPPEESPEPLVDGSADLGALAVEFLLLGLDPYPRKPGAEFAAPAIGEASGGPFAALAALKAGRKPDSGV